MDHPECRCRCAHIAGIGFRRDAFLDDNHSVASGGSSRSSTNEKTECPHCQKEFQNRAIFNHIRTKHPKDLIDSTITKWIGEAEQGAALKVVWFKKNDFDEEEDVTIYACLSSNKTFTTEVRANAHFKKNPDHRKEHVKVNPTPRLLSLVLGVLAHRFACTSRQRA